MEYTESKTEAKILQSAEKIFQEKGFDGARMQEIADHARINKGLLHYYFRSKNKLFQAIFNKAFDNLVLKLNSVLGEDVPLMDKIGQFIDKYIDLIKQNPAIPRFVINELNRNPDLFIKQTLMRKDRPNIQAFFNTVEKEVAEGKIKAIKPEQLLLNIISMCIFPFVAKPMVQTVLELDNKHFNDLMEERKVHIREFISQALKVES